MQLNSLQVVMPGLQSSHTDITIQVAVYILFFSYSVLSVIYDTHSIYLSIYLDTLLMTYVCAHWYSCPADVALVCCKLLIERDRGLDWLEHNGSLCSTEFWPWEWDSQSRRSWQPRLEERHFPLRLCHHHDDTFTNVSHFYLSYGVIWWWPGVVQESKCAAFLQGKSNWSCCRQSQWKRHYARSRS